MDSGNPAMFNRYAYALNDPINMFDPDGACSQGSSESQTICATEDAVKNTVGMAIYNGIKAVANVARAAQGKGPVQDVDMGGEEMYGHEAEANSVGEEVAAVAKIVGEAGVDRLNPIKPLKKLTGKCCFVAGTLVETEDGLRPIEEIEIGDSVLARDEATGDTAYKPVTDLITQNERIIWDVEVKGVDGALEAFETTDDHPWWVIDSTGNGSWKTTDTLLSGMVVTNSSNQSLVIEKVGETSKVDYTYNLTVADYSTYFVGQSRVFVHNCDPKNLKKLSSNKRADKAAQDAGFKDAHDAKDGRGDSKVNIYRDKKTKKHFIWDGNKDSEPDPL